MLRYDLQMSSRLNDVALWLANGFCPFSHDAILARIVSICVWLAKPVHCKRVKGMQATGFTICLKLSMGTFCGSTHVWIFKSFQVTWCLHTFSWQYRMYIPTAVYKNMQIRQALFYVDATHRMGCMCLPHHSMKYKHVINTYMHIRGRIRLVT